MSLASDELTIVTPLLGLERAGFFGKTLGEA
jgi:hypothetical protein